MPTLYYYLRCEDLRSPGVTEQRTVHSDYVTMMMMMTMMKDDWAAQCIVIGPVCG